MVTDWDSDQCALLPFLQNGISYYTRDKRMYASESKKIRKILETQIKLLF